MFNNFYLPPVIQRSVTFFVALLLALSFFGVSGCSSRARTTPRSEVIKESEAKGIKLPSIDEERANFYAIDKANQERLLELIKRRSTEQMINANYIIGPQDEVEINVFDVPELNLNIRVKESGMLSLPLIGAIKAQGLTDIELTDELRKRLKVFVRDPQVSVFITTYASQKVSVVGAVEKPGNYPLKKGANSLIEVLGEAGGLKERAGSYINFVPAELSGMAAATDVESRARLALAASSDLSRRETGVEIFLDNILGTVGGIPIEVPVRGGDMIVVPESGKVTVEGEVQHTGAFELGRQMSLIGAIGAAGGITYGAKIDEIEVVREVGHDKYARLVVDLQKVASGEQKDIRLRNGDIVRVPSDSSRRIAQDTFEAISRVVNLGVGGQVNVVH